MTGVHITGTVEALAANIINATTHAGVHDSIRAAEALAANGLLRKTSSRVHRQFDREAELWRLRANYIDAHALHACVDQYEPEFSTARSALVTTLRNTQTDREAP